MNNFDTTTLQNARRSAGFYALCGYEKAVIMRHVKAKFNLTDERAEAIAEDAMNDRKEDTDGARYDA